MKKWPISCPPDLFPKLHAIMSQRDADPHQAWAEMADYLERMGVEPPDFPSVSELSASKD